MVLGLDMRKRSKFRGMPDGEFIQRAKAHRTLAEFGRSLGLVNRKGRGYGNGWAPVRQRISDLGLDAHFRRSFRRRSPLKLEEVLVENSPYSRASVVRLLLAYESISYVCALCNMPPFWHDSPLVLHLDHINGVNNDHRLKNIRWLCPNCHSQTPTYTGRNKPIGRVV